MKWGITRIHALVPRKSRDYGGKALGLAVLARAGFPVLPAFAVPGVVADEFIASLLGPDERLDALLEDPSRQLRRDAAQGEGARVTARVQDAPARAGA